MLEVQENTASAVISTAVSVGVEYITLHIDYSMVDIIHKSSSWFN